MQKVIRRTMLAEKQAARRLAKRKDQSQRDWDKSNREQVLFARKQETQDIKNARHNRKEDRELGPLAPKRDVGDARDTYGTISGQRIRSQPIHYKKIAEVLKSVGYTKRYKVITLVVGDRVVLLEGRDKGKIGVINSVDIEKGECAVEGLNMVDVAVPSWMLENKEQDQRPIRSMEKPIPLTSVRLVHPVALPGEPGPDGELIPVTKDVIIKRLVRGRTWKDKLTGKVKFERFIDGYPKMLIPVPEVEPEEIKDHDVDTLRVDVELRTYVPSLLRPPFPSSVIDELRNKYSVFRTKHDPEYVAAKKEEDQQREAKMQQIEEMLTPINEINRRERALRKKKGRGKLTREMMARIGQTIAEKKGLNLSAQPTVLPHRIALAVSQPLTA